MHFAKITTSDILPFYGMLFFRNAWSYHSKLITLIRMWKPEILRPFSLSSITLVESQIITPNKQCVTETRRCLKKGWWRWRQRCLPGECLTTIKPKVLDINHMILRLVGLKEPYPKSVLVFRVFCKKSFLVLLHKKKPLIREEKLVEKLEKSRDIYYIDSIVREMLHFRK